MRRSARAAIELPDVTGIVGLDVAYGAANGAPACDARIRDDLVGFGSLQDGFRAHDHRIAKISVPVGGFRWKTASDIMSYTYLPWVVPAPGRGSEA